MAINAFAENSATIGTTEYFLASNSTTATYQTSDGVFQIWLELQNMAAGDEYRLRIYEKVNSGSTARVVMEWVIAHAQSQPVYVTPSLVMLHGWEASLTKLTGTDRSFAWSIRQVV